MPIDQLGRSQSLCHADLSTRPVEELSAEERAELNRRYDDFMRHFRTGKLALTPSSGMARRIRKWRP
jgi:hypothetical protein